MNSELFAELGMAEDYKIKGNTAVSEKKWTHAESLYTCGIECLQGWEKDLRVQLLSNRSFARLHTGKYNEALDDAEAAIQLDKSYEKAYLRKVAALEALKLKRSLQEEDSSCPVLQCFQAGFEAIPGGALLGSAMKVSFPWMRDDYSFNKSKASSTNSTNNKTSPGTGGILNENSVTGKKKKSSAPTKAQRDSCEPVDIRGAIGPHELRINGVYIPTDELSGGWPVYRKRTDDEGINK